MNLISLSKVSKAYGIKTILNEASFGLSTGERVGLVGPNGSGKSTLIRIIMGQEEPDKGEVHYSRDLKISYLPQEPELHEENTIFQEVLMENTRELELLEQFEALGKKLDASPDDPDLLSKLESLQVQMERYGAWEIEHRVRQYMRQVGIDQPTRKIAELSGGERKKVAIAKIFLGNPQVLLLDEPTNHLDTMTIEWLEQMLMDFKGAVLLVTHDRYFLTRVTEKITDLDNGKLSTYPGNYDRYLWSKAQEMEIEVRTSHNQLKFLKRELEWLRKMPRGRGTKAKSRVSQFGTVKEALRFRPSPLKDFGFGLSRKPGNLILEWTNLGKKFDRWLFRKSVHKVTLGEKIGIIGRNGAGKSTFIKVLLGKIKADEGAYKIGTGTHFAYFDQSRFGIDPELSVLDNFKDFGEYIQTEKGRMHIKAYLDRFHFDRNSLLKKVSLLSGGETARLLLAKLVAMPANFLILDEPTNDLDLDTLRLLEEALIAYPGCALIVSHDRYFLDRVCTSTFEIGEKEPPLFSPGNYSHFQWVKKNRANSQEKIEDSSSEPSPAKGKDKPKTHKKFGFKQKRELEELEIRIDELENLVSIRQEELQKPFEDAREYQVLADEYNSLQAELNQSMERWAELEELKEEAGA